MATGKNKYKGKNFDDALIQWIYDSKFYPNEFDNSADKFRDFELSGIMEGAKSYEEAKNRILQRLINDKDKSAIGEAVRHFNAVYGNDEDGFYTENSFPDIDKLEGLQKDLKVANYSGEEVLKRLGEVAKNLDNADANALLASIFDAPVTEEDVEGSVYKSRLDKILEDAVYQNFPKYDRFYKQMGLTPNATKADVSANIMELLERANMIRNAKKDESPAQKILMPYGDKSVSEGRSPSAQDVAADLLGLPADIAAAYLTRGRSLPARVAGGGALDLILDPIHDAVDSARTEHVYSFGEGDKDIRRNANVRGAFDLKRIGSDLIPIASSLVFDKFAPGLGSRIGRMANSAKGKSILSKANEKISDALDFIVGNGKNRKKANELNKSISKSDEVLENNKLLSEKLARDQKFINQDKPSTTEAWRENFKRSNKIDEDLERLSAESASEVRKKMDAENALELLLKDPGFARKVKAEQALDMLIGTGAVATGRVTGRPVEYVIDLLLQNDKK